jgi:hypothetical protein
LALLEYNNELVEKADQLSCRVADYITYRGLAASKNGDRTINDVDRLRTASEALAGFRSTIEHSRPNPRVRTLGLAYRLNARSNSTHENQYDDDDQDDTDDTDATVTESVTVAAEAATEATKQENNEDDNEDRSERHGLSPIAGLN